MSVKNTAGQYYVHLGVQPDVSKNGKYAQWQLNKKQLGEVLKNWDKVQWDFRRPSRPSKAEAFHSTAIQRKKLSVPISEYLQNNMPNGRVLYHGVGRDDIGAKTLGAEKYDPFHPDPSVRENPKGSYDEIHNHYTLNVVDKDVGHKILSHIYGLLKESGKAVISVRRDESLKENR